MSRLALIACAVVWLSCVAAIRAQPQPPAPSSPSRPNVVFILADDLGWSDLGCYGADLHETPNLDRLAREGVRFTNAYAASVCSPTRAALMTGKHYARLHITIWYEAAKRAVTDKPLKPPIVENNLPHGETTIAKRLQAAGYLTAIVGKWHLGDANFYPETHGFDINIGGTHWGAPHTHFFPYRGAGGRFGDEFRYVPHLEGGKPGEYLTDRFTDEALEVIDSAGDRPFFLYLAHHAVHAPIEAKKDLIAHYEQKLSPGLRHKNATYAAMVHSLDESVGRVIQRLERNGLADRTILMFMSDNGGLIGESRGQVVTNNAPLRSGKGSLYEGGVRVPFLVRWPGVTPRGRECHEPICPMDVMPTLAAATGLRLDAAESAALDGQSLVPILKNPDERLPRDELYFHYPHYYATTTPASAIRQRDWKLIEYLEDGRSELYNLKDDLSEGTNLAETNRDTADKLRDTLHAWRDTVGVQMPTR